MFSTKNAEINNKPFATSPFLSYGIKTATITGYELKSSKTGKVQVKLTLESPRIVEPDFVPNIDAKFGGQIGRVQIGIYFDPNVESEQSKEIVNIIAQIADKAGVREAVDTIEPTSLEDWLNKIIIAFKGKFVWLAITGEEYDRPDKDRPGIIMGLRRFGFVASLEEGENHLTPFDKSNPYDFKALAVADADPDAVVFKPQDTGTELAW